MISSHLGVSPRIDPTAYIAPNAMVYGNVTIGANARILFGAQIIAEGGAITIGEECVIMENAVLRSLDNHPLNIANNCLIGPHAHVVGCTLEEEVFVATNASVLHASHVGARSEIRIGAGVPIKTHVKPSSMIPIGWDAVGNPAEILPTEEHECIWRIQKPLNFPLSVYGLDQEEATTKKVTQKLCAKLASFKED